MVEKHAIPTLAPALAEPGLIIRTSINLGEQERVIQFEGFIDRDSSQSEIDHLCDKMVKAGDRLRAKHVLPSYRRNLEDVEYKTNENKKRLAQLEAGLKAMDEAREQKRAELQTEQSNRLATARDEHVASGRRGPFNPGASLTSRFSAQINQLSEAHNKEHAEAAVQRSTLDGEIKEGDRQIFKWKALIEEHEKLANPPANER
jgi:hypothetical protein